MHRLTGCPGSLHQTLPSVIKPVLTSVLLWQNNLAPPERVVYVGLDISSALKTGRATHQVLWREVFPFVDSS